MEFSPCINPLFASCLLTIFLYISVHLNPVGPRSELFQSRTRFGHNEEAAAYQTISCEALAASIPSATEVCVEKYPLEERLPPVP